MEIAKKGFLYAFSIILVISYFIILYFSLNPHVSWEYTLYYITQETNIWPGNNGYNYILGTKITPSLQTKEDCKRFGKGWGNYTDNGLWSSKQKSSIYFGNLPNKDLVFEMKLSECLLSEKMEIYFNNKLKAEIEPTLLIKEMQITQEVKKEDIIDGKLVVTLIYPEVPKNDIVPKILCKEINLYEVQ